MSAAVSAPAPDREAVDELRRHLVYAKACARVRHDQIDGDVYDLQLPAYALAAVEGLIAHYLARGPASDRFIDQTYLHLPPKERNNDRFTLGWRACERHHAIAAPPAAGEKEE